ncbi:ribonuclease H-like domain-containing protein [Sporosarcina highlanderae]|uniref:Ribonuclease H-like domain-containing protein n=1 Tax=Sporosarcina highlanderae TaxID=3035916 RepID=A0ABT8JVX0_9BACL|nr:ribonuclease H-like domain-containing protein [Sporosarcina highlanderae]MDN4608701.1 ribonuclease H-like domain-containing protein [Sporosarcina highlanderae]
MSYEAKLMQMKKLLKKKPAEPSNEKLVEPKRKRPPSPPYEENWLAAGLTKEENEYGIVYKRVVDYGPNHFHGKHKLSGLLGTVESWREANEVHPLSPDLSRPLVFFDTETTGLKGAGTLIFLLGFIEYTETNFTLTQYVLPGPDHEAAFLYASNFWKTPMSVVMYNGKSFDMPQVETRWTMNRDILPPLLKHTEIDLLHGSKRIWKNEMDTFKLTAVEEEQLGFFRDGDIPGYMAPIIYQDAVKNGRAEMLMKVLVHNEWDILSLVTLYIRSTNLLLEEQQSASANSKTNIGKWYRDLKSFDRSKKVLGDVIAEFGAEEPMAHFHIGFILKKENRHTEAINSFEIAADGLDGRESIIALEELAKLYEHKVKEPEMALQYTKKAIELLNNNPDIPERFKKRMGSDFANREIRLRRKLFPG